MKRTIAIGLILSIFALVFHFPAVPKVHAATDVKNDTVLSRGLVAYWKMEETSGVRYSATGTPTTTYNALTANGTLNSLTGIQGNGADFESGSSNYLSITDANQTNLDLGSGSTPFTISMWLNHESLPALDGYVGIADKWAGAGNQRGYIIDLGRASAYSPNYSSNVNLSNTGVSATYAQEHNLGLSMSTSTWYHHVVTYDPATGHLAHWVNNVRRYTHNTGVTTVFNNTATFFLGDFSGNLDGIMDEVGIWHAVLSTTSISDLYGSGSGLPYEAAGGGGSTSPGMDYSIIFSLRDELELQV